VSEPTDDSRDWPLREWSARLRPPGRTEPAADEPEPVAEREPEEQDFGEPEPEPEPEPKPEPESESEPEDSEPEPELLGEDEPDEVPAAEALEAEAEDEENGAPELEPGSAAISEVQIEEHAEGEFRVPDGYAVLEGAPTGHRRSVAIVVSRFNGEITNRLLDAALAELEEAGVAQEAVLVMPVPGAFELPLAAMALAKTRRYACVIALGCVIRGETPHFDFVAGEAASGLQLAGIETGVPVSFGVLTCDTVEQAEARVDRGAIAARTGLEMADAFAQLRTAVAVRA
jgi:6,7-dimethyl-8-ribityllumazine synthase